jgi:membrane protein DedA with SNARE-associated domain
VLFSRVALKELGAPLPALPILIAAGVLSASGQLSLASAFALGTLGCVVGDTALYCIGKPWGARILLRSLCKISLAHLESRARFRPAHASRPYLGYVGYQMSKTLSQRDVS